MRSRISGAMPLPLSSTTSATLRPSAAGVGARGDAQRAAGGHRGARVGDEVEEHLRELAGVGARARFAVGEIVDELDLFDRG